MVIGGVANLVWGVPRTTQDVDVTAAIPDSRLDEVIAGFGEALDVLPEDPRAFLSETQVLPLSTRGGVRVDLIRAGLPYEEEAIRRAVVRSVGGLEMRVATAEDLVIHKLASKRPRDLEDAVGVLRRQRGKLDRSYLDGLVRSLSDALDEPAIWETYERELSSP